MVATSYVSGMMVARWIVVRVELDGDRVPIRSLMFERWIDALRAAEKLGEKYPERNYVIAKTDIDA